MITTIPGAPAAPPAPYQVEEAHYTAPLPYTIPLIPPDCVDVLTNALEPSNNKCQNYQYNRLLTIRKALSIKSILVLGENI